METNRQRLIAKTERRATILEEKKRRAEELKDEGNEHYRNQRFEDAARCYEEAIMTYGPRVVYMSNLAAAYLKLQRFDEAHCCAEQALMLDHSQNKARYRRALARKAQGNLLGAAADLAVILRQEPSSAEVQRELTDLRNTLQNVPDRDSRPLEALAAPMPDDPYADGVEGTPWLSETSDFEHDGCGEPCAAYNHGGCGRGRDCPDSHAPDDRSVRDNLGRNVCLGRILGLCTADATCLYSHDTTQLPHGQWSVPGWAEEQRQMLWAAGTPSAEALASLPQYAPMLKITQPRTREALLPTVRARELKAACNTWMNRFMADVPPELVPRMAEMYRGAPERVRRGEVRGMSFREPRQGGETS